MPVKYIPYTVTPMGEQALLQNIGRSRRALTYLGEKDLPPRLARGLPYYTAQEIERVGAKQQQKDNLLIRGDAIHGCAHLKQQGIQVDLVYIDPPFASGVDYARKIQLRQHPHRKTQQKETSLPSDADWEQKFYSDIWTKNDYLNWMMENLVAIREVMSAHASIYVHLDWHIGHYVKVLMDEVFGEDNFRNEIIWHYGKLSNPDKNFSKNHDIILRYTKTDDYVFNPIKGAESEYKNRYKRYLTENKVLYGTVRNSKDKMIVARIKKRVQELGRKLKQEDVLYDFDEEYKKQSDVFDISIIKGNAAERTDYPTQKPEALLERIIKASSNEDMIVADFFGGSGTTAQVAARLGRKFISVDVSYNALRTSRDRLKQGGAHFTVLDIKDGVRLLRNPAQTMDRLPQLIPGLRPRLPDMHKFWYGIFQDKRYGVIPVYVPDLRDHGEKALDKATMGELLFEEIHHLEDFDVKKIVIYYVDVEDMDELQKFMRKNNQSKILNTDIELRDMKNLLDDIVMPDQITFRCIAPKGKEKEYKVVIQQCLSDSMQQKLDEYNQKRKNNAEPKKRIKPIKLSDAGLEVIEMVALDCRHKQGAWHSDAEIIIAPDSTITKDGKQTKELWDNSITCPKKPLRLKVRNIAGDEAVLTFPP